MERRKYLKLRGVKMTYCKYCQFPIKFEECGHQLCIHAYARGYCSQSCQTLGENEKQFILEKEKQYYANK